MIERKIVVRTQKVVLEPVSITYLSVEVLPVECKGLLGLYFEFLQLGGCYVTCYHHKFDSSGCDVVLLELHFELSQPVVAFYIVNGCYLWVVFKLITLCNIHL